MKDIYNYIIEISGQIDNTEINLMSPHELKILCSTKQTTQLIANTDQSGIIGLLRHIHSRGLIFIKIIREPHDSINGETHGL